MVNYLLSVPQFEEKIDSILLLIEIKFFTKLPFSIPTAVQYIPSQNLISLLSVVFTTPIIYFKKRKGKDFQSGF